MIIIMTSEYTHFTSLKIHATKASTATPVGARCPVHCCLFAEKQRPPCVHTTPRPQQEPSLQSASVWSQLHRKLRTWERSESISPDPLALQQHFLMKIEQTKNDCSSFLLFLVQGGPLRVTWAKKRAIHVGGQLRCQTLWLEHTRKGFPKM